MILIFFIVFYTNIKIVLYKYVINGGRKSLVVVKVWMQYMSRDCWRAGYY